MISNIKIFSYSPVSQSAKGLAEELGIKRIKHEGSRFVAKERHTVINWGASTIPAVLTGGTVIQSPEEVGKCSNKLAFFQLNEGSGVIPDFTDSREAAIEWCRRGKTVVCRQKLTGHSGEGIVIAETEDELVDAPLYVLYVKKKEEYRVHVFNGKVIDIQRKARRLDCEDVDWRVRNYKNGFIYAREGVVPPESVKEVALLAMSNTDLTFGAVDVIHNDHDNRSVVLEVNTAPGLTGTTLYNYVAAFKEIL